MVVSCRGGIWVCRLQRSLQGSQSHFLSLQCHSKRVPAVALCPFCFQLLAVNIFVHHLYAGTKKLLYVRMTQTVSEKSRPNQISFSNWCENCCWDAQFSLFGELLRTPVACRRAFYDDGTKDSNLCFISNSTKLGQTLRAQRGHLLNIGGVHK